MTVKRCLWNLRVMKAGIKAALRIEPVTEEDKEDREIDKEQLEAIVTAITLIKNYRELTDAIEKICKEPPASADEALGTIIETYKELNEQ